MVAVAGQRAANELRLAAVINERAAQLANSASLLIARPWATLWLVAAMLFGGQVDISERRPGERAAK